MCNPMRLDSPRQPRASHQRRTTTRRPPAACTTKYSSMLRRAKSTTAQSMECTTCLPRNSTAAASCLSFLSSTSSLRTSSGNNNNSTNPKASTLARPRPAASPAAPGAQRPTAGSGTNRTAHRRRCPTSSRRPRGWPTPTRPILAQAAPKGRSGRHISEPAARPG